MKPVDQAQFTVATVSTEMEAALLGHLLLYPDTDTGRLSGKHFSNSLFGMVFDVIVRRKAERQPVAPLFIVKDMGGLLTTADALSMVRNAVPLMLADETAEEIYRSGTMRLIEEAAAARNMAEVARLSDDLQRGTDTTLSARDRLDRMYYDLHEAVDGRASHTMSPTGLRDLDHVLGGYGAGDLIIVAGRPGMGKSIMATNGALGAARAGHPVLLFSLEMRLEQVYQRIASDIMFNHGERLSYQRFRSRDLTHRDIDMAAEAIEEARALPIEIVDTRPNIHGIRAQAKSYFERMRRKTDKSGVLIVDYLGLVQPDDRYKGNRVNEVSEISSAGKIMANELGVCSLFLSQLNRGVEAREDKRPFLSDLRDSGSIEQDADSVVFVYRDAYYLKQAIEAESDPSKKLELFTRMEHVKHEVELIVAKNRHGPTTTIRAFCDVEYAAIRDLAREEYGQ